MSQLAVRPGRNAAREAKRLKEVRKVKGAIVWTEREREKRQKLATERWEAKQAHQGLQRWEKEQVRDVRTAALRNAKEDWRLGPLRPNRAIGKAGEKYGALSGQALQTPDIPVHASKSRNEARARRGLELEYPLVVDDKKYFPFVKDDRVVVIKGREKGKIGVIQSVNDRTHGVFLTGLNMHYYDADVFGLSGDGGGAKRANEVPIPIEDLRLVVPYEMTEKRVVYDADGQELEKPIKYYTDVIVDKIFMERHTTGIDPFDGTNYGDQEIPKEHQYDPQTGLPIFHRYIAGTKHRLDWPWEKEEVEEDASALATAQATAPEKKSLFQKIRHPIQTVKSWKTKDTAAVTAAKETEENLSERLDEIEQEVIQARRTEAPTSQDPKFPNAYDVTDTTRNIIEAPANVHYTILSTPFPPTLGEELRGYMQEYTAESRKKDKDDGVEAPAKKRAKHRTEHALVASQMSKAKHAAAQQMKTPMQLRWETERAKKVKKAPLVSTDELVRKLSEYRMTKRGVKVEELD